MSMETLAGVKLVAPAHPPGGLPDREIGGGQQAGHLVDPNLPQIRHRRHTHGGVEDAHDLRGRQVNLAPSELRVQSSVSRERNTLTAMTTWPWTIPRTPTAMTGVPPEVAFGGLSLVGRWLAVMVCGSAVRPVTYWGLSFVEDDFSQVLRVLA